jgi:hypothetical protein
MTNHSGKEKCYFSSLLVLSPGVNGDELNVLEVMLLAKWRTTQTKRQFKRAENYYRHTVHCLSQADADVSREETFHTG